MRSAAASSSIVASAFFEEGTWSRLRMVKPLYDPGELFKGNHHIPPASSS